MKTNEHVWFEVQKQIGDGSWINVSEYSGMYTNPDDAEAYKECQIKFFNDDKIKFRVVEFRLTKKVLPV